MSASLPTAFQGLATGPLVQPAEPFIVSFDQQGSAFDLLSSGSELITGWPDMRLCCCTHVVELVEGNFLELIGVAPFAPTGNYASALGRREARANPICAVTDGL